MVEFKCKVDEESVGMVLEMQLEKQKKIYLIVSILFYILGALCLVFAYDDYVSGEPFYAYLVMGLMLIFFGMVYKPLVVAFAKKIQHRQNQSYSLILGGPEYVYKFDDEKVYIFITLGTKYRSAVETDYDYFYKVVESRDYYVLYMSKTQCYIINKDRITMGCIAEFNELLSRNLPAGKLIKSADLMKK